MAEQKRRTASGIYQALNQIASEEGVDFGLNGVTEDQFKQKYFTRPEDIGALYDVVNGVSDNEGIDFGQGTREEWLASFGPAAMDAPGTKVDQVMNEWSQKSGMMPQEMQQQAYHPKPGERQDIAVYNKQGEQIGRDTATVLNNGKVGIVSIEKPYETQMETETNSNTYNTKSSRVSDLPIWPNERGQMVYGWKGAKNMDALNENGVMLAGMTGGHRDELFNKTLAQAEKMSDEALIAEFNRMSQYIAKDNVEGYAATADGYRDATIMKAYMYELHARDLGLKHDRENNPGLDDYLTVSRRDNFIAGEISRLENMDEGERRKAMAKAYRVIQNNAMLGADGSTDSAETIAAKKTIVAGAAIRAKASGKPIDAQYKTLMQDIENTRDYEAELEEAQKELEDIEAKISARMDEMALEGAPKGTTTLGKILMSTPEETFIHQQSDPTIRDLTAAKNETKDRIRLLEAMKNGGGGFMQGLWHAISSPNTYSFGLTGLLDAQTKMLHSGDNREPARMMMRSTAMTQLAHGRYDEQLSDGYSFGQLTGNMIPFAAQIAATGGYAGLADAVANLFPQSMRYLGVGLGELAAGWALANTVGMANTWSDAINRYLGDVHMDADGNYYFDGGDPIWTAIYKAQMSQAWEYGSEGIGKHMHLGARMISGMNRLGAKRLSDMLTHATNSGFYQEVSAFMNRLGLQGLPEEGLEEEINLLASALLVGDNNFSLDKDSPEWKTSIFNPDVHKDIWEGMAVSMMFMGAVPTTIYGTRRGYYAQRYYHYQHAMEKAGLHAEQLLGDQWPSWQERIDGTDLEGVGSLLNELSANGDLSPKQKMSLFDYIFNLQKMRGYNLRKTGENAERAKNGDNANDVADDEQSRQFSGGYETVSPEERRAICDRLDAAAARLAKKGYSEQWMLWVANSSMEDIQSTLNERGLAGDLDAVTEYLSARAAYDGMLQRMDDDTDNDVAAANEQIDQRIAPEDQGGDGMIHPAVLKDGREVFIVSGNVATLADNSIDTENSDGMIIVRDADGNPENITPNDIESLGEVQDPEQLRSDTEQAINEQNAQAAAAVIDGQLAFNPGDVYTINYQGEPHTYEVVQADENNVAVLVDGAQEPVVLTREQLQQMADEERAEQIQAQADEPIPGVGEEPATEEPSQSDDTVNQATTERLDAARAALAENSFDVETYDGASVEYLEQSILPSDVVPDDMKAIVQEYIEARKEAEQAQQGEADAPIIEEEEVEPAPEEEPVIVEEEVAAPEGKPTPDMPMDDQGEPAWDQVEPERGHQFLYQESGWPQAMADNFVQKRIDDSEKALKKAQEAGQKLIDNPKPTFSAQQQAVAENTAAQQAAQSALDYWKGVQDIQAQATAPVVEEAAPVVETPAEQAPTEQAAPVAETEAPAAVEPETNEPVEETPAVEADTSSVPDVVAADYLINSGSGSILSTEYFIRALAGLFPKAASTIRERLFEYAENQPDLSMFARSEAFGEFKERLSDIISIVYDNEEIDAALDKILQYPTGLPVKVGHTVSELLERLGVTEQEPQAENEMQPVEVEQPAEAAPAAPATEEAPQSDAIPEQPAEDEGETTEEIIQLLKEEFADEFEDSTVEIVPESVRAQGSEYIANITVDGMRTNIWLSHAVGSQVNEHYNRIFIPFYDLSWDEIDDLADAWNADGERGADADPDVKRINIINTGLNIGGVEEALQFENWLEEREQEEREEQPAAETDNGLEADIQYSIEHQGEVPTGNKQKKFDISEANSSGNGNEKAYTQGVYHDPSGKAVSSDGRIIVVDKRAYDKQHKGKLIASKKIKKGTEIKEPIEKGQPIPIERYPNWKSVKVSNADTEAVAVDFNQFADWLAGVEKRMKEQWQQWKEQTGDKVSFDNWKSKSWVQFMTPDGTVRTFMYNGLNTFVRAAADQGAKTLKYYPNQSDRAIQADSKNGFVLMMPLYRPDYSGYHVDNPYRVENGMRIDGDASFFTYDMSKNGTMPGKTSTGRVELNYESGKDAESRAYIEEVMEREGWDEEAKSEFRKILDDAADLVSRMAQGFSRLREWNNKKLTDENGNYNPLWRVWDKAVGWIPNRSSFKKNGEYPYNIDLGALCTKREAFDAVVRYIKEQGWGQNLGPTQIEALKSLLREHGFLTACDICFNETKRARALDYGNAVAYYWNAVRQAVGFDDDLPVGTPRELTEEQMKILTALAASKNGKAFSKYIPKEVRRTYETYVNSKGKRKRREADKGLTPTMTAKIAKLFLQDPSLMGRFEGTTLLSTDSVDALVRQYPHTTIAEFIAGAWGSATPKPNEGFNIYDPLSWKQAYDKKRQRPAMDWFFNLGGFRAQSFSDYSPIFFYDYVQMFTDLAIRRLPIHIYTKVPALIKLFGGTGAKFNMSLVPEVVQGVDAEHLGLKPDGNGGWELAWHEDSFPVDEAFALREDPRFMGNVGTIAVGISDAHIRMLLDDPRIDMVIPYHKSGMPKSVQIKTGLNNATDYTDDQNTKGKKKGLKDFSFNEALRRLGDPRLAAQEYLAWCKQNKCTPKFPQFADHPNYYKVLEDFRCIDNEGNYSEQQPVRMSFFDDVEQRLSESLGDRTMQEGLDNAIRGNDAITEGIKKIMSKPRLDGKIRDMMLARLKQVLGKDNVASLKQEDFFEELQKVYTDQLGADRAQQKVEVLRTSGGIVYGFAVGGRIVLNENYFNAETPMHEFTHVWVKVARLSNPQMWTEGKELLKQTKEWQDVMNDEFYSDIHGDEDAVASEVLARIVGQDAASQINEMFAPEDKPQERPGIYNKIKQWVNKFLDGVRSLFDSKAKGLTYDELVRMPMKALFDDTESARFMEALAQVNEEDAVPEYQAKSLGAPYQGSKGQIATRIVDALPSGKRFVDLFSGGGAVTHAAMLSGKYEGYRMNDINPAGQELFLAGMRGDYRDYQPRELTAEEFKAIKGTPEGLLLSYSGLGRNVDSDKESVARRLRRVQRLEELKPYADQVESSNTDYREVQLQPGDVVYADIPYEGTNKTGYREGAKFDKQAFSDWALDQDVPIYVSEQSMPEGWVEVQSWDMKAMRGKTRGEKLFVQAKFADNDGGNAAANGTDQTRSANFKRWFGDWELAQKQVDIIHSTLKHGFKSFSDARSWAKKNIVGTYNNAEIGEVRVSGKAIDKYLSEKAVKKSENQDAHLSALKVLPNLIETSIVGEIHNDRNESKDIRDIVRLFACLDLDGNNHVVKITVKRYASENEKSKAYTYEVTEIEPVVGTHDESSTPRPRTTNDSISAANLLQGVEKSNKKGEKLLDSSKVVDEEGKPLVMTHNTDQQFTIFDRGRIGTGQGQAYIGLGFNFSRGRNSTYGGNAMEVYLNARNPLQSDGHKLTASMVEQALRKIDEGQEDTTVAEFAGEFVPYGTPEYDRAVRKVARDFVRDYDDLSIYSSISVISSAKAETVIEAFKELGFDSTIERDSEGRIMNAVVFDPNQVKSADELTFDDEGNEISEEERYNPDEQDIRYRELDEDEDAELIDRLENGPHITTYSTKIKSGDGYVPPMSSKDNETGKMRAPEHEQKWNESEERPDLAKQDKKTGKWKFDLKKSNDKDVSGVLYNPYNHSGSGMLNDQFSEAQDRDDLVVVEQVVPQSEETDKYKAEKANDPTGWKAWKAGPITAKMTGKRKVFLSRWHKITRVVPWSEVADAVAKDLGDQFDVLPTNPFPPQLRAELEKKGYKFIKTDNKCVIQEGEYKGATWSERYYDVYPDRAKSKDKREKGARAKAVKEQNNKELFDTAKRKFGETKDIREAGYVLPDGTMLDFSGRHELDPGSDSSHLAGSRYTDHRAINQISFVYDENGDEVDTGVSSDMPDFIKRGAIRIDANNGLINLSTKPTPEQRKVLRQLVAEHGGTVDVDFGDGWDTEHSAYYDETKATKVLGDIDRYFDEGIKPEGNARFREILEDGGTLRVYQKENGGLQNVDEVVVREDNGQWVFNRTIPGRFASRDAALDALADYAFREGMNVKGEPGSNTYVIRRMLPKGKKWRVEGVPGEFDTQFGAVDNARNFLQGHVFEVAEDGNSIEVLGAGSNLDALTGRGEAATQETATEAKPLTAKQRKAEERARKWRERTVENGRRRVEELGQRLGVKVTIVDDMSEQEREGMSKKKRRAKGWYDVRTGEVFINLGNHKTVSDIEATFLHEVVAHKGLRRLFGEEFNTFLHNVYYNVDASIREEINRLMAKNNWDYREATEEYLAKLAQQMNFERPEKYVKAWETVARLFRTLLQKMGLGNGMNLKDSDLQGILFESYHNMEKEGVAGLAESVEFRDQMEREANLQRQSRDTENSAATAAESMFRDDEDDVEDFEDSEDFYEEELEEEAANAEDLGEEVDDSEAGPSTFQEMMLGKMLEAANSAGAAQSARVSAMRSLGGALQQIRKAMSTQRNYDRETVNTIVRLAREVMASGYFNDLTRGEVKRLLAAAKNANGSANVTEQANKVVDTLLRHHLRECENLLKKQLKVKGSKQNASGVEVQAGLDIEGQRMTKAMKQGIRLDEQGLSDRVADCLSRMGSSDPVVAAEASQEYTGLVLAQQYHENIKASRQEEQQMREEMRQAKAEFAARRDSLSPEELKRERKALKEYLAATEDAIRQNRMERADAYNQLSEMLGGGIASSMERAKQWREQQRERVGEIQHNANSDLEGVPADEHMRPTWKHRMANWELVRFFMKPLATFDYMLRMMGQKSPNGEGYLWNRFMGGWVEANDKEWRNIKAAHQVLDEKVKEVFNADRPGLPKIRVTVVGGPKPVLRKVKRWSDLFFIERKMPGMEVDFWDGDEIKTHTLTPGNLLYIYMVNKMSDGKMKLRKMGISEEDVEAIKQHLDPRLIELADWLQDEFLVQKRVEYNAVHERMFGAPMAAIENYFPLEINSRSRSQEEDVNNQDANPDDNKGSTITGAIIKRVRNNKALDVTGADAFDVILEHIQNMEHWAAFAEFNRDLNTLLSYKRFRNRILNMASARFGSGQKLWTNFKRVCAIASGVYRPRVDRDSVDTSLVNIAKGVTRAKISFRFYTALKQLLSYPAYLSEASPIELAKTTNPIGAVKAWKWAIDNLPGFAERWQSRQAGDTRLKESDADWGLWKKQIIDTASRWGMSPNAFIDALTVVMGAKAIYETKRKQLMKLGYTEEQANKRALRDASVSYNETQQSSANAFTSAMQLDRTAASVALTVFRNASMGYERRLIQSFANLKHIGTKGYRAQSLEYLAKQMERDGLDRATAEAAAKKVYNRALYKNVADVAIFGWMMQALWNLGSYLPYLFMGDDDDDKKEMLTDAMLHAIAGGIEGLTGGSVISDTYNSIRSGDAKATYSNELLPLLSDMESLKRTFKKDVIEGANDLVNLIVQAGVGVNPQTITDWVVAGLDAVHGDPRLANEFGLLVMRIMSAPQGQLDKLYIDELGLTAGDARKLNAEEFAQRYARYKMGRESTFTGWAYSEAGRDDAVGRYVKNFDKKLKERLGTQAIATLEDAYERGDAHMQDLVGKAIKKRLEGMEDGEVEHVMKYTTNDVTKEAASKEVVKRISKKEDLDGYFDKATDPALRKAAGQEIAKRLGTQDYAGRAPQKRWTQETRDAYERYQELRTSDDIKKDSQIYLKATDEEKAELREIKKQLGQGDDDAAIMQEYREARAEILKNYQ